MSTLFQTLPDGLPPSILDTGAQQSGLDFPESLAIAYQPKTLSAFVGLSKQKAILSKLALSPHPCGLLMAGPPGTGKTSMAFAFARSLAGGSEIHHVPSAECKLETLQTIASTCHRVAYDFQTGTPCKWHAIIADEADLMSSAAQVWLLSRLDGSNPLPYTLIVLTTNSTDNFHDRLLSRLIQLPPFNSYGAGAEIKSLLARIWQERANGAPLPDMTRIPTGNLREALQWLEVELLSV